MLPPDHPEVADWLLHAEQDALTARLVLPHGLYAIVGFHCQQDAEKRLKAILTALSQSPPRTHHLPTLLGLCRQAGCSISDVDDACHWLSPQAIVSRYPGHGDLSAADAQYALECAAAVHAAVDQAFAGAR